MSIQSVGNHLVPTPVGVKRDKAASQSTQPSVDAKATSSAVINYSPQLADQFDSTRAKSRTQYDAPEGNASVAINAYKRVFHMDKADEIKQMLGVDIYA